MRTLLTILSVVAVASIAWAEKPIQQTDGITNRIECTFNYVAYSWEFGESDHGFTTSSCDEGGAPVWEYGIISEEPAPLWGTVLGGVYPNDAGESLISPAFLVDETSYLVGVWHAFSIESGYDGGNLSVNGIVVEPMEGYPDEEISDNPSFYAWCVEGEPGFTGDSLGTIVSCFDLSSFTGQEVQLSFDFGSDSSVPDGGWYIGGVGVGSDVVANDGMTWSALKALYR